VSILPYRLPLNGIVKRGAFYSKHALVIVHSKTAMYSLLLMLHYDLVSTRHVEEISISTLDNWIGHFISWQRHVRCERSVGNQEITMNRIESQEISFSNCCLEKRMPPYAHSLNQNIITELYSSQSLGVQSNIAAC
jgi:hypothetical protein